jgi:hypothetical protein
MTLHLSRKQAQKLGLIDKPARGKGKTTGAHRPGSYAWAVANGWQFSYRNIGGGKVACRAHHTARGIVTAWLTDDSDGRGAVLAALGEGEK